MTPSEFPVSHPQVSRPEPNVIATATVQILPDTSQFDTAMDRVRSQVESMPRRPDLLLNIPLKDGRSASVRASMIKMITDLPDEDTDSPGSQIILEGDGNIVIQSISPAFDLTRRLDSTTESTI
jgi:hypothetical protein